MKHFLCIRTILICSFYFILAFGENREKITTEEKIAIKKLRSEIQDIKYLDYQDKDIYLVHWLRARDLDVKKAKIMLAKHFEWRKENKIDGIKYSTEMKLLEKDFPIHLAKYFDKQGRPGFVGVLGDWNIRLVTLKGKRELINRMCIYYFEQLNEIVRNAGLVHFVWLVDMSSYSLRQQGCLACLPFYTQLVMDYDNHYPNNCNDIILVNTPRIFETVLNLIKPLMSPITRKDFQVFGPNKEEWKSVVFDLFDAKALPPRFGGTGPK